MRLVLVSSFPPCKRNLAEYGEALAQGISDHKNFEVIVLAEISEETGDAIQSDLPNVRVIPCWRKDSLSSIYRMYKAVIELQPDLVWFNLIYSSFGRNPVVACAGFALPWFLKRRSIKTVATLHHLVDHLKPCGFFERMMWPAIWLLLKAMTFMLLKIDHVYLLLEKYVETVRTNYNCANVSKISHGFLSAHTSKPAKLSGQPRVLVFGSMGTYKTIEPTVEAMQIVWQTLPEAELIVAGENHPSTPFYLDRLALSSGHLPIKFVGYVPDNKLQELFDQCSLILLPYIATTGASGVAHLACSFGLPIVSADVGDLRSLAEEEKMAMKFTDFSQPEVASRCILNLINHPLELVRLGRHNYNLARSKTMRKISDQYAQDFGRILSGESYDDAA